MTADLKIYIAALASKVFIRKNSRIHDARLLPSGGPCNHRIWDIQTFASRQTASKLPSGPTYNAYHWKYPPSKISCEALKLMVDSCARYPSSIPKMGKGVWSNILSHDRNENPHHFVIRRSCQRTHGQAIEYLLFQARPLYFPRLDLRRIQNAFHEI